MLLNRHWIFVRKKNSMIYVFVKKKKRMRPWKATDAEHFAGQRSEASCPHYRA